MDTLGGHVHDEAVRVRVQRVRGEGSVSYTVIGAETLLVPPIEVFLVRLVAKGRSPATVKGVRTRPEGLLRVAGPARTRFRAGRA